MAQFDLDRAALEAYLPEVEEPADFDDFWEDTLAETAAFDLAVTLERVDTGLELVETYDVTFAGFGGHPVKGWLTRPAGGGAPRPGVVEYVGYGGGRGLPYERIAWANAGYVHLVMDTRGQGSTWGGGGSTPDPVGSGPAAPGFLTRGILDPTEHYYRRVFADAVRAVGVMRSVDGVDPDRVAVTGISQGGGITLAAAGLVPGLSAVMPDVPFLCHYRRATSITDSMPYAEVTRYLAVHRDQVDRVFGTLAYFDGVSFAKRATAPTLFSVALMDMTCPPSTVYAAFNHYGTGTSAESSSGLPAKEIAVYPFNQHEGGAVHQFSRQLQWLAPVLKG